MVSLRFFHEGPAAPFGWARVLSSAPVRVLIVEDDVKLSRFLVRVFVEEGWTADACSHGRDAIQQALSGGYDLIVLDWMLPDIDGVSVCRELRDRASRTPILMLTARSDLGEKVIGLDAGADDYLVKPFELEELLARVRALVRRASGFTTHRVGPLEIDPMARAVRLDRQAVQLTAREYALLLHLVQHKERVVTRTKLLVHIWGLSFDPGSNLVDVHISRLRQKLGAHAAMIETIRGVGYRLTETPAL